ncbi:MAG: VUT family protein [Francisellaceae bacterium]
MTPHYKVSNIDPNTFSIEYYDTLTKKGTHVFASALYADDIIDLFSENDQRMVAYHAGKQEAFFGKKSNVIYSNRFMGKQYILIILVSLYAVIFFASNISGSTLIDLESITGIKLAVPMAIFIYAFTFLLDSILTEIYGFSIVRRIYTSIALCSLGILLILKLLSFLPTINDNNYVHDILFSQADIFRVFSFSFISFIISEYINSNLIARIKYHSRKKYGYEHHKEQRRIISRFLIASGIGTLIDSAIFCFGVFLFTYSVSFIFVIIATQYVIKLSYDILTCLISSKIAMYIKGLEKVDIVELPSNRITGVLGFKIDTKNSVNAFNYKV